MKAAQDCVLDMAVLGAPAGHRPIGGDWWADLAIAMLVCLWILFPQKSGDKLALWRDVGLGRKRGARARVRRRGLIAHHPIRAARRINPRRPQAPRASAALPKACPAPPPSLSVANPKPAPKT